MRKEFISVLEKIEEQLKKSLPEKANGEWKNDSFGNLSPLLAPEHFINLIEPNYNLMQLGGKRWRPLLLVLCAQAKLYQQNRDEMPETAYKLTPLVEFVHTASLIHDDIEDGADLRRGKPCAHMTYGTDVAINAASWLYFEAAVCIEKLDCSNEMKKLFYQTYTQELRRLHLGQALDITWHHNKNFFPLTEEYLEMVRCKTGTLASLSAKTGILSGGGTLEEADLIGKIAADIGCGFQIIDDVINLTTGNPGKKRGDDIVEGKKSLPVILFNQKADSEQVKKLTDCFVKAHSEGIESPGVEQAISLLEASGVISEARQKGIALIHESCRKLREYFGENNPFAELISLLFSDMIPEERKEQVKTDESKTKGDN